jgi:hypothetical protein
VSMVLEAEVKPGQRAYLDKTTFRKMMIGKGFKGHNFLVSEKAQRSPKPTGKHFQKLYKDSEKRQASIHES